MGTTRNDNRLDWLALHLIPGLGNMLFKNLLEKFGDPDEVFRASLSELLEVNGIRRETALRIVGKKFLSDPATTLRTLERLNAHIITYKDPDYPAGLREIYDPPMVLYAKGKGIPKNITYLAVVGSRNPTPYGLGVAEKIAQGLARRGLGVVSGMARGIDSAAHWGCINGKGFTLAVLGTGIDIVYPASNRKLSYKVLDNGTIITEFPLKTPPEPQNFPIRNRIISGLSKGVVVVEATKNSGSLITASLALDQGREVFAVPGSVNSFKSAGCHFLIKQGAQLIENADDVLEGLGLNFPYAAKADTFRDPPPPSLQGQEEIIYSLVGDYPIHIDQISRESKMEPREVSSILMRLELKGIVKQLPGKMFVR
ncbi:MAG: DNA-protecting protein DprA [Deltaproteobacteria bacterium]|nr:DNA-protecting protein DprA [Deltaproteobacteria bacterium]MBW2136998.1 DNA-protecting protein DprA [Deltaproteobacteria bacterium]